jgi:predicted amidophosphoribosyltransferase
MARVGNDFLAEADLLVPVPLHRRRLAARRFNQANALAQVISAQSGVPVDPFVLTRVKPTPSQVGLSRP